MKPPKRGPPQGIRFTVSELELLDRAREVLGGFAGPIPLGTFVRWAALQHARRLIGGEPSTRAAIQAGLPLMDLLGNAPAPPIPTTRSRKQRARARIREGRRDA
jgi:hypothetical protein